ncbi:hypothetical protein VaNZ11_014251 [Volvox africanus]|uniref:Uncharacterized protein n=1 Tax=Volvox africanus TaxID=51714 RepID=A0ABQ5SK75_9CHLO|nr:hypothetical protein VaNZ11_014251 [Volvox africanus]
MGLPPHTPPVAESLEQPVVTAMGFESISPDGNVSALPIKLCCLLITNTYLVACMGFFWFVGLVSIYVGGAGMNNPRLENLLALSFWLLGHVLLYIGPWKRETLALCVQMLVLLYCVLPMSWFSCLINSF